MSSSAPLASLSLGEFAARIADPAPVPAGGSAAAAIGAIAASLAEMGLRQAEAASEEGAGLHGARADEVADLALVLLELVDRDAQAFRRVLATRKKGGDSARRAVREAREVPLETADLCLAAWRLLDASRAAIPARLVADVASAEGGLRASIEASLVVACDGLDADVGEEGGSAQDILQTVAALRRDLATLPSESKS